jgi:hypothetical protein
MFTIAVKTHSLFHNTFYSPSLTIRGKYTQYLSKRPSGSGPFLTSLNSLCSHTASHLTFHTSHTTGEREASFDDLIPMNRMQVPKKERVMTHDHILLLLALHYPLPWLHASPKSMIDFGHDKDNHLNN